MKKIFFVLLAISLIACKSNKKEQAKTDDNVRYQETEIAPETYYSEDITFENEKESFVLAGTLTLPAKEGNFPAVVLISGSGLQNRDEEILGHKPFLILSDHLTRNGIAVLRFDDRGFGESKGDVKNATTENFADDVHYAVKYLLSRNEIDKTKIGLIGHSEGGIIAPMIAAKSDDIAFIVLLAGSGLQGKDLLLLQTDLLAKVSGISDSVRQQSAATNKQLYEIVCNTDDRQERETKITECMQQHLSKTPAIYKGGKTDDEIISATLKQLESEWITYFIRYNPAPTLEKVKCPVLAVNGSKDLQVPSKENLEAIENALKKGGNTNVTIKEFEGLNHLFQECNTGSPAEYGIIKQTFSPTVLSEISQWILEVSSKLPNWILGTWSNSYESNTNYWESWIFCNDSVWIEKDFSINSRNIICLNEKFQDYKMNVNFNDSICQLNFVKDKELIIYEFKRIKVFANDTKLSLSYSIKENEVIKRDHMTSCNCTFQKQRN